MRFHPRAVARVKGGSENGVKEMPACPLALAAQCYCANQVSSFAASEMAANTAVLLLAHGSPENPSQVPEFLRHVTGGRPLPPAAVQEVPHRYSPLGFSPLGFSTLFQAHQLSQAQLLLPLHMPRFGVMRNWIPV